MTYLAVDPSKRSTGWALWDGTAAKPTYGHWQLGSELTTDGKTCATMHERLMDLHRIAPFEHLWFEIPLTQIERGGKSNPANDIQLKLIGHVESFGEAFGMRSLMGYKPKTWQNGFIGRQSTKRPPGITGKKLVIAKCRHLGLAPRNDDEADAIGILTYCLLTRNITPPWMTNVTLDIPLVVAGGRR